MNTAKKSREAAGLKVIDVAEFVGVSPKTIYKIEAGILTVENELAEKMAKLYGVDITEIFETKRYKTK